MHQVISFVIYCNVTTQTLIGQNIMTPSLRFLLCRYDFHVSSTKKKSDIVISSQRLLHNHKKMVMKMVIYD